MLQQNGLIKIHHNGIPITFDDLEVELLDRVEHSSYYKCKGFDSDGNIYIGVIEKCCGEYEGITDIELDFIESLANKKLKA